MALKNLYIIFCILMFSCGRKKSNVAFKPIIYGLYESGDTMFKYTLLKNKFGNYVKVQHYYQNGNKEYSGFMNDSKKIGDWIFFSEAQENMIVSSQYYKNGEKFKSQIDYYPNGKIKQYKYYSFSGLVYSCNYTIDGLLIGEEGCLFPMTIINGPSLKAGDVFVAKSYIVSPPHLDSLSVSAKLFGLTKLISLTKKDDYFEFRLKMKKKGKFTYQETKSAFNKVYSIWETKEMKTVITVE